jgi:hypothetical protein
VLFDVSGLVAAGTLDGSHVLRPELVNSDGTLFTKFYATPPVDLSVELASDPSCAAP